MRSLTCQRIDYNQSCLVFIKIHTDKFRSYEIFTCVYPPLPLLTQSELTYLKYFEENECPGMTQAKSQYHKRKKNFYIRIVVGMTYLQHSIYFSRIYNHVTSVVCFLSGNKTLDL